MHAHYLILCTIRKIRLHEIIARMLIITVPLNPHYNNHNDNNKPVEFCSDVFLLPLGSPPIDTLDINRNIYLRDPNSVPASLLGRGSPSEPLGPSLTSPLVSNQSYYELLLNKLEFNNNNYVSSILNKHALTTGSSDPAISPLPPPLPPLQSFKKPPTPPARKILEPIYESHEAEEYL